MRAIWFILKLLLKIVVAPVILALTLFVWLCAGLVYLSGLVLGLTIKGCRTIVAGLEMLCKNRAMFSG